MDFIFSMACLHLIRNEMFQLRPIFRLLLDFVFSIWFGFHGCEFHISLKCYLHFYLCCRILRNEMFVFITVSVFSYLAKFERFENTRNQSRFSLSEQTVQVNRALIFQQLSTSLRKLGA